MRLRIIAESNASVSIRRAENRATFSGSNSSKARRYPSRFFSTIVQLNPACAPSSTRNSKCLRSSWTGTPHSRSWYWSISGSSTLTHEHRLIVAVALRIKTVFLELLPDHRTFHSKAPELTQLARCTLNRYLLILKRLILESSVRAGSPSFVAAPNGPEICP